MFPRDTQYKDVIEVRTSDGLFKTTLVETYESVKDYFDNLPRLLNEFKEQGKDLRTPYNYVPMNKGERYDVHLLDGTIMENMILDRIADFYLLWRTDTANNIMTLYREINYIKQL